MKKSKNNLYDTKDLAIVGMLLLTFIISGLMIPFFPKIYNAIIFVLCIFLLLSFSIGAVVKFHSKDKKQN